MPGAKADNWNLPEIFFNTSIEFSDFDDFEKRVIQATHSDHRLSADIYRQVQKRFADKMTENGGRFTIPIRVDLLRNPALDVVNAQARSRALKNLGWLHEMESNTLPI